jgi:outer membrane protein assembly factor BamB/tetratricopeptide (TPR) repeat protein
MFRLRRALDLLGAVGLIGALAIAFIPAQGQGIKAEKKPAGDSNKNPGFTDAVTFPTDRKAKRTIEAAAELIKEESWGDAARLLQRLLDTKEDIFVEVQRNEGVQWASLKTEANRLLGSMPPDGRQFYETLFGGRAKARLTEAKAQSDPQILAEVAQRYLHTEAGAEATNLLGTYHLDRGRSMMAALCFERLFGHEKAEQLPPLTLLKAVLAFRRAGDKARAEDAWNRLAKATRTGVVLGDRTVSLDELRQELDKVVADLPPTSPYDWALFKGNPSRSAVGNGSPPFLEVRWTHSTIRESQTKQWLDQAVKRQEEMQYPVLPSSFPVAATVQTEKGPLPLLLFRSYWGIHALNLQKEGKEEWNSPSYWSLDNLAGDQSKAMALSQWLPLYLSSSPNFLFENSTIGTLSTDNNRVYIVDDLAVPPHPGGPPLQQLQWGGQASFGPLQDAVYHNRLQAFDLATGKIVWELGGRGEDGELNDSYFLGPPLPLGGKLYVLNEKNSDLRLVILEQKEDKRPPVIAGLQTLVHFNNRMLMDVGRRIQAAHLSYGEGMLVCPTNAGVVLGIDFLNHSLAWAYSYREESSTPEPKTHVGMGRRGGMIMAINGQMLAGQNLSPDWKTSAPIIQDGKVVFTAPDGPSVHCLNLRDGKRIWKESRADDLYLGGVYNGKVLLVGKSTCRALSLADGKKLWKIETGLPSGQGVASDHIYYLPVKAAGQRKEPGVCLIDMDRGRVQSTIHSRKKDVPGNLLFYEGDILSQTVSAVTAFPQLRIRLAQIDEALKKDPKDPIGLTNRGELKLDQGDLPGAVEDLRTALANSPPAEVLPRTRLKLYETYTELFQRDFASASDKYLDDFKSMCEVTIPAGTPPEEVSKLQEEQQRRQANYLCLLAKGREQQGRLVEAFAAYLDFGSLAGNRELITVIDEPGVKARPDVWAKGRIAAMVQRATPEQRKPIEDKIAEQWRSLQGSSNTEGLRHFVALFGSLSVGKEARLQLADRLIEENGLLEAELQLLQLRRQEDPLIAARAVEVLARLMIRKGLLEDAAYWYRVLGRDFSQVMIRDGKTGADFLNDLASDKRFLPYLEDPPQPWTGARLKARQIDGNSMVQPMFVFEGDGEPIPFFERNRLTFNSNSSQLRLIDRVTNEERWTETLPRTNNMGYWYNSYPNPRYLYHHRGHLMVLNVGHMVYAFDPVDHRKLWETNFFGPGMTPQSMPVTIDPRGGGLVMHSPDGVSHRLGQVGPVEANYVCVQTREGLTALDPLKGTILWTKIDVPVRCQVFGDDQHVYLVESRADGTFGGCRALRASDGVSVDVPEFSALFQHRQRIVGRNLLLWETAPEGGMVLRLYDVQTGKDVLRRTFSANAIFLQSDDPQVAGVAEPQAGGKITALNLGTNKEMLVTQVDPKDIEKVQEAHLLLDNQQFYLVIQRTPDAQANPWGNNVWQNVGNGLRWIMVNGKVYAFDRQTGKTNWWALVPNQMLIMDQFQDMPMLLFTAQYNKAANPGQARQVPQHFAGVKSIDKRTGKLLWDKEYPQHSQQFYALQANLQAGTIDFACFNMRIQHYLASDTQVKTGDGSSDAGVDSVPEPVLPRGRGRPIQRAPRSVP